MSKAIVTAAASRSLLLLPAFLAFAVGAPPVQAQRKDQADSLRADLAPLNQVPAVLAKSRGTFTAHINNDGTISFSLSYAGMSSSVTQAHIHFGASKTNGGVIALLCGGQKPACPASGTVTGTIAAADVSVLPPANRDSLVPQGIVPGDLGGLLEVIRSGDAYVNVHSDAFPAGEIRGQVEMSGSR
jgi:CHRD domain